MLQTNEQIIEMMEKCRVICSIGHSLRSSNQIPVRLPIKEVQFEGVFLYQPYIELIKKELNSLDVNPFICKEENKLESEEEWVELEKDGIKVALNVHISDWQIKDGLLAKQRRTEIMNKKQTQRS